MELRKRLVAALLAGTVLAGPLSANDLPELGDAAGADFSVLTEKRIGQRIMNEIRWRGPSYLDDPDIEDYLSRLGQRLVAVSPDPGFGFEFFALSDPSINAFAMPGGYIGLHAGLILAAQSESELAGVLAHEVSHVTQRHIARQIFQSRQVSIASMVATGLALLAARSNSQAAGAAIAGSQAGAISAHLAFSRDFERESDRVGFDMLRQAGFDPRGMSQFFHRLQQAVRLHENQATAYLRTHPLTAERLADMQNREVTAPYRQVADSLEFHLVRARLRAQQGRPEDAVQDFRRLLQEGKFSSEAAVRFGLAQAYVRQRDWGAAGREIDVVRGKKVALAMVERLAAEIRLAQGAVDAGLRLYRDALSRYPQHLGLIYGYGAAQIREKRFADALRFVEKQLTLRPEDIRLHRLRAEGYAGMGRQSMYHAAFAEAVIRQGQTAAAIEQLELAQKAGDADFFQASAIDARLRELRLQLIQEMKERNNSG